MFFDVFLSVATRARKLVETVEAEEKLPVDLLEWRFLIPPRHVYRALMVNEGLEDAAGWAGRAIREDEAGQHVEALESLIKAKKHLEESRWFRNASDDEVDNRIAKHYCRWILFSGSPIYRV